MKTYKYTPGSSVWFITTPNDTVQGVYSTKRKGLKAVSHIPHGRLEHGVFNETGDIVVDNKNGKWS